MWFALVGSLAALSAITIYQIPREWFKKPLLRTIIILYQVLGITSTALLLFGVHRMNGGLLKEIIIWTETIYFCSSGFALVLSLVRYLGFQIACRFHHRRLVKLMNSSAAFYTAVILLSALYLVPATYNTTHLTTETYNLAVNKSCADEEFKIALIADFHIGGGAGTNEMNQMVSLINRENVDAVVIAGDTADSSSSVADLEFLEESLKKINSKYGVFYAEGNHERECNYDVKPYIAASGAYVLDDRGIRLDNGVNIIGRTDGSKIPLADVISKDGLNKNEPCIVVQHKPSKLKSMSGTADVVLCGHTHGYQFPFMGAADPYLHDLSYGQRSFDDGLQAIVTSGAAEWGYRSKWPSQSEVAIVNLKFGKVTK